MFDEYLQHLEEDGLSKGYSCLRGAGDKTHDDFVSGHFEEEVKLISLDEELHGGHDHLGVFFLLYDIGQYLRHVLDPP